MGYDYWGGFFFGSTLWAKSFQGRKAKLTWSPFPRFHSLPLRPRLHLHPARPRRRPPPLRKGLGALESHTERGEDSHQRDEHAGRAQRREPGQHRSGEDVEGEEGGV